MSETLVQTSFGQVIGENVDGIAVWKGIPYAKAPIGKLRFSPPQSPDAWEGVYEATQFGPSAIQPEREMMRFLDAHVEEDEMSEDCLYLNIWSPGADNKKRAVMVWIHGGAFMNGSGNSKSYNGASFAAHHDVVVVTINYRLGVFGFLHLGSIDNEQFAGTGNCGILDQIAALKWVKENIEAFGGDPNNITVFGESAGAMSIGILLAIPSASGLFQKAILQSGAARNVLPSVVATQVCTDILAKLGIDKEHLSRLEEVSTAELLEASRHVSPMLLGPVIDGVVIQEPPELSIVNGASKHIDLLIGTTKDEYCLFTYVDAPLDGLDEEGIDLYLKKMLTHKWDQIKLNLQHETLNKALVEKVLTFDIFTAPAIWLAEQQARQGASVWMYRFDWESPVLDGELKACHALEIPFVWHQLNKSTEFLLGNAPDYALAHHMHKAWATFAKEGDPNIEELPTWPAYHVKNRETMLFDVNCQTVQNPDKQYRLIWDAVSLSIN
ncbi:carboxylesterase/lipase family protein [Lysinibacillus sp. KU-BSD001]|uniref:carboxylesterase/lipase family protein n=1 Tax=Lysinibacillus sp. KU-BSD001 TaxID=3141328 RepID=UPI0036EF743C